MPQCKENSKLNEKTGFCVDGNNERSCPKNKLINYFGNACMDRCNDSANEKPLNGVCVHVCTSSKTQGFGGNICPDGRPGMALDDYLNKIKEK